jgi:N-acetylglutamate synthase-like GNAT family acetyltransferase
MNPLRHHRTRRANADDLPQLIALWQAEKLPVPLLEKQLTDFQVLESPDDVIIAAIALQVSGTHGRIHSETIGDFSLADSTRALLWQQLQTTSRSLGLIRLWTREIPPFWRKDAGFNEADAEALAKFPPEFAAPGAPWLALRLRDEAAEPEALAKQFEMFKVTEQQKRERTLFIARALGITGTVIALLIFVLALIFLFQVWHHR